MLPIEYIQTYLFLFFAAFCAARCPALPTIIRKLTWFVVLTWGIFIFALRAYTIIQNLIHFFAETV